MTVRLICRGFLFGGCSLAVAGAALAQPANDLCTNATVISSVPYASGNVNYGTATNDTGVNPSCDSTSNTDARQGVWWTFTPASNGLMSLAQVASPSQDTATSIWTGTCGALTQVSCSDPETSTFIATGGVTYYILISKWNTTNATAASNVSFTLGFAPIVPTTDSCASPTVISSLPYAGTMAVDTATDDTNANPSCDSTSNTAGAKQGVWFSYTAGPAGAGLLLSETGSQDVVLTAWSGASCAALTQVLCSDSESNIALSVPPNTTYLLMVSKFSSTSYAAGSTISFTVAAASSACCNSSTGACTLTATTCGTGTVATGGTTCAPDPCSGACCRADGTCTSGSISACNNVGIFGGGGSSCPPGGPACPASIGRCCTGATCAVGASTACTGLFTDAGTCTTNLCSFPCCDVLTGTCSVVATGSTCSGVSGAGGATCSAITCAAPANDVCANAEVIPGSGPFPMSIFGQNATATDTVVLAPTITPCGSSSSSSSAHDVFYTFTPAQTRTYSFTLCNAYTGTLDTVMSIHTGCPATNANNLLCNDDGCSGTAGPSAIGGFAMTGGTTYIIRVARWSTGAGGKFQLDVTTEAFGACCDASSVCTAKAVSQCTSPNIFVGDGTTCATSGICNGACCVASSGVCTLTTAASCTTGTHGGVGSTCTQAFCPTTACCDDATGVCTSIGSGSCPSGSTPHVGAACSPTPCPGPTNDECSGAIALTIDAAPISGSLATATGADISSCSGSDQDLWYSVHVTSAGTYQVLTVPTGSGTALAVYPGAPCPVVLDSNVACGAQSTTSLTFSGAANSDYLVRVADFTGDNVSFTVQVVTVIAGACCNNTTGACTLSTSGAGGCVSNTTYQGDNSVCLPSPCLQGACCNPSSGVCTLASGAANCASGTTYQGDSTTCTPSNPCPQPPPTANDLCPGPNLPLASLMTATTVGATGNTTPTCSINCPDTWWDFTAPFADTFNFTVQQTANGQPVLSFFTDCAQTTELGCISGGRLTPVSDTVTLGLAMTAGQNIKVRVSSYACIAGPYTIIVNSTLPSGACCTGASCALSLASACSTGYQGDNSVCTPSLCTPAGVCCRGATCSTAYTSASACAAALNSTSATVLSKFATTSGTCNTPVTVPGTLGNTTSPCCYANYNHNATLEVQDIFDYLNDWFAGKKAALVGGDGDSGTLAVQNIFDFLNAWFAGGCN